MLPGKRPYRRKLDALPAEFGKDPGVAAEVVFGFAAELRCPADIGGQAAEALR
jgi:hypothetical protein